MIAGCSNEAGSSDSASYPERQIELVVPFAAGGGVDLAARAVAEYLSKEWGQSIVVTNKTGGGGIVGAQYALKEAKPDGYTVLVNNNSSTTMYEAGTSNPTITSKDNKFVSRIAEASLTYAVKADAEWESFKEFSDWVKANPEELTWASVGPAGFSSFGVAEWLDSIGVDYKQTSMVSSEGASDSTAKVAGGHVILAVHNVGEVYSLAESGKIKVLAVQSSERSPLYPDVPTVEEEGFTSLKVKWWTGLSFAADVPDEIVEKWDEAVAKMEKDEDFIAELEKIKLEPSYLNSADFTKAVKEETELYTKLAETTGIRK
ncbi:tripartite tricarboxylate transporter substrate binding protein [Robertmurraya yapensis]|uniref:Tripartite tricarboxylate transporter substrate binding protein n=2 Tax=Bacillaceae TaxID=186817 RepID=A0A3S0L5Q3_9BACI|nr:tripartite tricarboxylate transporter substrate binding protein [Bacillus yapensis]TKS94205.1 tripartite tricarboxylate transporter substrate binding protein [Bacillus yapensis]